MSGGRALSLAAMSRLSWRYLWRNYRRTSIMLLAIGVGVWAMIFMTALMRGMVDQMVEDGIDALPGQVQVHHADYRDDPSVENSLSPPGPELIRALQNPEVTGWTSRVRVPAMISSERDSRGVTLLGVDPETLSGLPAAELLGSRAELVDEVEFAGYFDHSPAEIRSFLDGNAFYGSFALRGQSYIGPAIGDELLQKAFWAILGSLTTVITPRFRPTMP